MSIIAAPSKLRRLFTNGTSVGNGADTTTDTLHTYTVQAGQLANVGDTIRIKTGGTAAATTDSKVASVTVGGTVVATFTLATAGLTGWWMDITVTKTGANAQSFISTSIAQTSGSPKTLSGTITLTDTSTIVILVRGQNATAATANSVTAQLTTIDFN